MIQSFGFLIRTVICILLLASQSGCWSRNEVDELSIVMAVGLDKPKQKDHVRFTAQIFKPKKQKDGTEGAGDGVGGGGDKAYLNITSTRATVYSSVQEAIHQAPRDFYFAHNQAVIISKSIAEGGVQPQIDFFMREHQTRLTVWVLIARDRADEILALPPRMEELPALDIADLVDSQREASQSSIVNLKQFAARLMSRTTAPVAPFIEIAGKGEHRMVRISGTAVFKKDKLAGQLNQSETRGLLWAIGEVKRGIVEVGCPGGEGKASIRIIRAASKIVPEREGNTIRMKIKIKEEGILGSQSCPDNLVTAQNNDELEKRNEEAIRHEVMAAVTKAKQLRADIYGFGDMVHRKYPKLWKQLEGRWDEVFPTLEVEMLADVKIPLSGRITQSTVPVKE